MKIKIIGAGSIGNHLAHASRQLGWAVDMVDVDPAALERTQANIYPTRYGQWDEGIQLYLSHAAPKGCHDLIIVGTPPDTHMALSLEALEERPQAILIEKPVCTPDLEHADELLTRARANGCRLFVGYDHVVGAAAMRMCELIESREIGEPQTLDVEFREHWGGIFAAHPWLSGPADSYLGFWRRGGGATGEHSHALNLWQHFAHQLGMGRVTRVTATLDYIKTSGAEYDRLCLANLVSEQGLIGRVVQDVVTSPPRKWARLQGSTGYVEWQCGYEPGKDAVKYSIGGQEPMIETISKTRPDDFIAELGHILAVMEGDSRSSVLSIERGLDTMMLIAALHKSAQTNRSVSLNWENGYTTTALQE
jgi:predicted dehydrogenase